MHPREHLCLQALWLPLKCERIFTHASMQRQLFMPLEQLQESMYPNCPLIPTCWEIINIFSLSPAHYGRYTLITGWIYGALRPHSPSFGRASAGTGFKSRERMTARRRGMTGEKDEEEERRVEERKENWAVVKINAERGQKRAPEGEMKVKGAVEQRRKQHDCDKMFKINQIWSVWDKIIRNCKSSLKQYLPCKSIKFLITLASSLRLTFCWTSNMSVWIRTEISCIHPLFTIIRSCDDTLTTPWQQCKLRLLRKTVWCGWKLWKKV